MDNKKLPKKSYILDIVFFILVFLIIFAFRIWTAYKRWDMTANQDVSFWEFFFYNILIK